jgi:hypothetical protein
LLAPDLDSFFFEREAKFSRTGTNFFYHPS